MTILLIDDDAGFRSGLAAILRDDGYEVEEFRNPAEVPPLRTLSRVDAVISDYQMSGQDGVTFADRFHAAHPAVPVVLITAYWTNHLEAEAGQRRFLHLLRKPIDYDELHTLLLHLNKSLPA